jgi:uncharacterized protein YsxB (DUF464 family)
MIIELDVDSNKIIKSLVIKGHGGFGKKGKDVVCAGISTLVTAFNLSLINLKNVEFKIVDEKDYLLTINGYNDRDRGELKGLSLFLTVGLKAISKEYKNYLKLKVIKE